ncbi:MAG: hypothetical protein Ct9H90mP15_03210 [Candidatus Neomarinimicrobiota bacterium]|nr:MAG: hypothetical protein Ct9H90mP15_03210 [Candidatus Neomarinimicrobiota bacterium]
MKKVGIQGLEGSFSEQAAKFYAISLTFKILN